MKISDMLDDLQPDAIDLTPEQAPNTAKIQSLTEKKLRAAQPEQNRRAARPALRAAMAAAAVLVLGFVTVCAASSSFRSSVLSLLHIGTQPSAALTLSDSREFTLAEGMEGVELHYLVTRNRSEEGFSFYNNILISYSESPHFQRVTTDYQIVPMEEQFYQQTITCRDRTIEVAFYYTYQDDGKMVTVGNAHPTSDPDVVMTWLELQHTDSDENTQTSSVPIFVNIQTGEVTDPTANAGVDGGVDLTDLPGRAYMKYVDYDEAMFVSLRKWPFTVYRAHFADGTVESIPCPESQGTAQRVDGSLYWLGESGTVYRLTESGQWETVLESVGRLNWGNGGVLYGTTSQDAVPVVVDICNGEIYTIPEWQGIHFTATRYEGGEKIALIQQNSATFRINAIGLLSQEEGTVQILSRESGQNDYAYGWLDTDRFMILCEKDGEKYICLYEFDE